MPAFLGQADGGLVVRLGAGTTDAPNDTFVALDVETWDARPGGSTGDVVWREVDVVVRCANGCTFDVTPIIDDVALTTQRVSASGAGTFTLPVYFASRGSALRVRAVCVARGGDVELIDVAHHYAILRVSP